MQFRSSLFLPVASVMALASPAFADDVHYPVQIENCGSAVTIEAEPQRIFSVNNDDIPLLHALGILDRVVARTSEPLEGVYSDEVMEILADIPVISKERTATGGSIVTLESVLAQEPDLVLAPENAVDRLLLEQSGVPLYSAPAYCADAASRPSVASYDLVYDQVRNFGEIFGMTDLADEKVAELQEDVAAIGASLSGDHGTGIAIYVSATGILSPYGAGSMNTPIFEAAGLENVYKDEPQRVFDASLEDILGRNPETVVLLYGHGTADDVINAFNAVSGVQALSAVQNDRVVALQFPFTDPPTPLSVQGAAELAELLNAIQ